MTQPHIRPFALADSEAVIAIWEACHLTVPWNDPHRDIARKMQVNPELFLVAEVNGRVVGTVMGGYEGHRGWVNYLAVHPDAQKQGVGRALMQAVEAKLLAIGCPKINLQVRQSNTAVIQFYGHLDYHIDDVISLGKRLIEDERRK
ncbi:MAG: GNAT family acetyltransferase [Ardenticatenaceae bacterium]|nr:GNAT family acetyltransferase [Anaerolineales bacterium]MCB8941400.1 GNAT family acetyltransferase [Ardenticatenaceae bacterium]MCB8972756.1 GNAT family acetyltransferase [Ardenticatenaceae bacterium]